MKLNYACCICNKEVASGRRAQHRLDPCALVLVSNVDGQRAGQREQQFYCHFECFRRTVRDDSILYVLGDDFPTIGDIQAERGD
jgi:hypothetical protein